MKVARVPFLLVMLAAFFVAGTASAAPPLRDSLKGDARAAFDEGTRLYKDGRFDEARTKFQAAYDASNERRLLFNVAVCDKALGHSARAIHEIEDSLSDRTGLPPDYVTHAQEALATLREHVSQLTVDTSVPGATIKVDGEEAKAQPVLVDEGTHVVIASKDGYQDTTEKFTATGGQPSRLALVLVLLPPKVAHLRVASDRPDDTIMVDDKPLGLGPIDVDVAPGDHTIVVSRPGGNSKKVAASLKEGETRELKLTIPEKKGISAWWFVAGGVVLAGVATTAIVIATRPTKFEGSNQGNLQPYTVTAGYRGDFR